MKFSQKLSLAPQWIFDMFFGCPFPSHTPICSAIVQVVAMSKGAVFRIPWNSATYKRRWRNRRRSPRSRRARNARRCSPGPDPAAALGEGVGGPGETRSFTYSSKQTRTFLSNCSKDPEDAKCIKRVPEESSELFAPLPLPQFLELARITAKVASLR